MTIIPKDPDAGQLKRLNQKMSTHMRLFEELIDISFEMFEELRRLDQDSSLLIKWRWKLTDLL